MSDETNKPEDKSTPLDEATLLAIMQPTSAGFKDRITPKSTDKLLLFQCPSCKGVHFRHAGYVKVLLPFMGSGLEKKMALDNHQVMVCVGCKASYAWVGEQMYDLTDRIDLKAWEKVEVELNQATGPGGNC